MLSHETVRGLLARFTYKPNWTIEVLPPEPGLSPDGYQPVFLYLSQYVENSREPFQPWDLRPREPFEAHVLEIAIRHDRLGGYAYSPQRRLMPVGGRVQVPPIAEGREQRFWIWLHDVAIPDLERHEMSEWFKVDGKVMFDPHREGAGR